MHEHILTESSKNIKNHIKEKLTKTQKNTNSKIFLTFNSNADNNSCTTYDGNQYEIILNGEIPLKVALEHELAHIIYKSHYGYSKYLGILDDWILSTGINSEQDTLLSNKILHRAFNIMEDIRIEYLDGLNDPHTQNSYERSLKNIGQSFLPDSEPNPLSFLLNKRFFREDLISDDFYVEMDIIFNKSKVNLVTKLLDVLKDWLNYGSLGYYILDEVRKKSEIY
jgi:hypothetical protein